MVYAPAPPPLVPGNGNEFAPMETAAGQRDRDSGHHELRWDPAPARQTDQCPPPGGAIMPRRPSAGLVGRIVVCGHTVGA